MHQTIDATPCIHPLDYLPVVKKRAKKYLGFGLELEELVHEGFMGLLKARDKFEEARGFRFVTYARWWIDQTMNLAIMNQAATIRIPVYLYQKTVKRGQDRDKFNVRLKAAELVKNKRATGNDGVKWEGNGPGFGTDRIHETAERNPAILPDPRGSHVEEVHRRLEAAEVRSALERLSERERVVLRGRYGFDGEPRSREQVGTPLGLSIQQVATIEGHASKKLRWILSSLAS